MMLKMRSFLPGRFWMKKGLPLLAIANEIVINMEIGLSTIKPKKAAIKSKIPLIKSL
jgi:hypothetical protein